MGLSVLSLGEERRILISDREKVVILLSIQYQISSSHSVNKESSWRASSNFKDYVYIEMLTFDTPLTDWIFPASHFRQAGRFPFSFHFLVFLFCVLCVRLKVLHTYIQCYEHLWQINNPSNLQTSVLDAIRCGRWIQL